MDNSKFDENTVHIALQCIINYIIKKNNLSQNERNDIYNAVVNHKRDINELINGTNIRDRLTCDFSELTNYGDNYLNYVNLLSCMLKSNSNIDKIKLVNLINELITMLSVITNQTLRIISSHGQGYINIECEDNRNY